MAKFKLAKKQQRPLPLMKRLLSESVSHKSVDWQAEIAESLMQMLNTHQGSALGAPDFGLPDFSPESVSVHTLRQYEQNMKNLIRKYEPRFQAVQVLSYFDTEHKNHLIFHLQGRLDEAYSLQKLSYVTVMTDQGRILMRAA